MHYLLFYEKVPNYAAIQGPLAAPHLEYVRTAVRHGEVILAGSLADPADGSALLLFRADSPSIAESFAAADPYVTGGVICRWWVRKWETVLGDGAAVPLPDAVGDERQ